MADINLLPEKSEKDVKVASYKKGVNFTSLLVLLGLGLIILLIFGYWLFLGAQSRRIDVQTENAENEILAQSRKEITRRALVEKLDEASKFILNSLPFSIAFERLIEVLSASGAQLTDSQFKDNGDLLVTGQVANSAQFAGLVNGLTDEKLINDFAKINLVNLDKEETTPYQFTIDMRFLKKGIPEATSIAR